MPRPLSADERAQLLSVLGLPSTASLDDARLAWRRKVRTLHPDQPGGSTAKMAEVNAAWDRLNHSWDTPMAHRAAPKSAPKDVAYDLVDSIVAASAWAYGDAVLNLLDHYRSSLTKRGRLDRMLGTNVPTPPRVPFHVPSRFTAHADGAMTLHFGSNIAVGPNIVVVPPLIWKPNGAIHIKGRIRLVELDCPKPRGGKGEWIVKSSIGPIRLEFLNKTPPFYADPMAPDAGFLTTPHRHTIAAHQRVVAAITAPVAPRWARPVITWMARMLGKTHAPA